MPVTLEQFGIDRLSSNERWELLGLIWDSLPESITEIPEWHRELLSVRLSRADANPDDVTSLINVQKRISLETPRG